MNAGRDPRPEPTVPTPRAINPRERGIHHPRPMAICLTDMQNLLAASRAIEGPLGRVLELSILTVRMPHQVVGMDLARIDWRNGICPVPGAGKRWGEVILSSDALATVLRIAGYSSGRGQAVTAGQGHPISSRDVRLARLRPQVEAAWPSGTPVEWSFPVVRDSAARILRNDGVSCDAIRLALGHIPQSVDKKFSFMTDRSFALSAINRWAELLSRKATAAKT